VDLSRRGSGAPYTALGAAETSLPHRTAFATHQPAPVVDGVPLDGYAAGDDDGAEAAATEFVRSIGARPLDAGPRAMARVLTGMALLNIGLNIRNG
jgi:predicted dinucleotide-binding enzyme